MQRDWWWITKLVKEFREHIDKTIDEDMVHSILTHLKYPFGKYRNEDGHNVYPKRWFEIYFNTEWGKNRIKNIIETIKYNKFLSDQLSQNHKKEYPETYGDYKKLRKEAEESREQKYQEEITNNPKESSMRYVSDQLLKNDEVMYENSNRNDVIFSNNWKFISYGKNNFDSEKFEKPYQMYDWTQKCIGGIWACPISTRDNWYSFCKREQFKTNSLKKHFIFTLKDDANIYVVDNEQDLIEISTKKDRYTIGVKRINYDQIFDDGYDGIFFTDNAIRKMRFGFEDVDGYWIDGLSTFDIESLFVFNPDVIIPLDILKESETEKLSDVETKWKPEDGLFTMKSASYIANYLEKNSESIGQAIKRLTFYMNRSGNNLSNKQTLNKAKKILQERNKKEKAD